MKKKFNICIVTYESMPNPITQNLKKFLLNNYKVNLLYIAHPMLEIKESYDMSSRFFYYKNNKQFKESKAFHWKLPMPVLYLKDVAYTLIWCFKENKKWDVYFASGNLNPIPGFVLKMMGRVDKIIYQSLDYYPTRFENTFLNWLYYEVDRLCVYFSDETWNVSSVMIEAREKKMGMNRKIFNRQYTVPGGIWFNEVKRKVFNKIDKHKIVYRGFLIPHMGVDLIVRAMPRIIKKIPNAYLEIIGGGEQEEELKKIAQKLKIEHKIKFHGFVSERKKLEYLLSDGAVGIATFNTKIIDEKVKNADPGKIKDYMLMGMPVIVTDAVYYHKKIEQERCGFVVDYEPQDLADVVIKLLTDVKLLKEYRQNALKFIKSFDVNTILQPHVERVLND